MIGVKIPNIKNVFILTKCIIMRRENKERKGLPKALVTRIINKAPILNGML